MRIRSYDEADVPKVVVFFAEAAGLDPTVHEVTEKGWREYAGMSFNHGACDFLVAEDGAALAAVAASTRVPYGRHFRITVHPEHRRRGLATQLLRRIEEQEGTPRQCNCMGSWVAGRAFLLQNGFEPTIRMLDMERIGGAPDAEPLPEGFVLRPYRETADDDAAWKRVNEVGYGDGPDYNPLLDEDLELCRATPAFHLWFAERDGEIVGLCHTKEWQGKVGCINSVVVDPRARGRGLGRALTAAGMRTLADQGQQKVVLSVLADNRPAYAIYERLGFTTVDEMVTWRK
jgi:mycothiol synthase